METNNPLETLRAYASAGSSLDESHVYLSDDGKTLFFLGGTNGLPEGTADATLIFDAATLTPASEPGRGRHTLAALYLLCVNPRDYVSYRKACERYGGTRASVRPLERTEILQTLLGEDEYRKSQGAAAVEDEAAAGDKGAEEGAAAAERDRAKERDEEGRKHHHKSSHHKDKHRRHKDRDKDRHHHRDKDKHHKHKDKDRHHKHHGDKHHRDKHHHRDRDRDKDGDRDRTSSSSGKKQKKEMTNEEVLENLTLVADKRSVKPEEKSGDDEGGEKPKDGSGGDREGTAATQVEADSPAGAAEGADEQGEVSTPTDKDKAEGDDAAAAPPSSPTTVTESTGAAEAELEVGSDAWHAKVQKCLSARGYIANLDDEDLLERDRALTSKITEREIPVGNSLSVLRAEGKDLSRVLDLFNEHRKVEERREAALAGGGTSSSRTASGSKRPAPPSSSSRPLPPGPSAHGAKRPKKEAHGTPIIVVPNAMTSPITLVNAEDFFGKARFVPRDVVLKRGGARKPTSVRITRRVGAKFGGRDVEYEIVDNPTKLKSRKDWDRIVAVVAQGASWQFKGWLWSNPVDIFSRAFGFYVGMEGAQVPKELVGWAVKKQQLHRDKRGLDGVTYAGFWNSLDEWMSVHKPEYLPLGDS